MKVDDRGEHGDDCHESGRSAAKKREKRIVEKRVPAALLDK